MKIEVKITDEAGNARLYNASDLAHLHCILNPHYDNNGRLDGGIIISDGKITGHIDPCGEEGPPGTNGITDYGCGGVPVGEILKKSSNCNKSPVGSGDGKVAICRRCGAEVPDHPKYRHTWCKECGAYGTAEPGEMRNVIFETKDCEYGMKLTVGRNKLIKIEPHDKGTELSERDVARLISVLLNWRSEQFTCKHCGSHEKQWNRENDDWYCATCGHICR